jgi:hypothetical protein
MQEKLESSSVGRVLISAFVAVTVSALVVWNLPDSKLKREGMRLARPYLTATGLDQNWSVFAPNPVRDSFFLSARVTYADGTRGAWTPPGGSAAIGTYWDFRWGKWAEWTLLQSNSDLCPGTATYIANREADAGREPVQVDLVARRRPNERPGAEPSHGAWQETVICTGRFEVNGAAP